MKSDDTIRETSNDAYVAQQKIGTKRENKTSNNQVRKMINKFKAC